MMIVCRPYSRRSCRSRQWATLRGCKSLTAFHFIINEISTILNQISVAQRRIPNEDPSFRTGMIGTIKFVAYSQKLFGCPGSGTLTRHLKNAGSRMWISDSQWQQRCRCVLGGSCQTRQPPRDTGLSCGSSVEKVLSYVSERDPKLRQHRNPGQRDTLQSFC
jgi:hypothetical protein